MISDMVDDLAQDLSLALGLTVYPSSPPQVAAPPYAYILPGPMTPGPRFGTLVLQQNVVVVARASANVPDMVDAVYSMAADVVAALKGTEWSLSEAGVEAPSKYSRGTSETLGSVIVLQRTVSRADLGA